MILSGLWKLAAMAGVIGVGLVAVFQAQKGMDKPAETSVASIVEDAEEPTDSAGDLATKESETPQESATAADNAESKSSPDPFAAFAEIPEDSTPKPIPLDDETPAAELKQTKSSAGKLPPEFGQTSTEGPSLNAKAASAPGLDFRDLPPGTDPKPVASPKPLSLQPASFEEEPPARLPDEAASSADADPFAVQEKPPAIRETPRREATAKPFVRQTNAEENLKTNADADPFGETPAKPDSDPFDVRVEPKTADNSSDAAPGLEEPATKLETSATNPESSADPFAGERPGISFTEDSPTAARRKHAASVPATKLKSPKATEPEADPFATTPAEDPSEAANPSSLPFPAADEPRPLPTFGQPNPVLGQPKSALREPKPLPVSSFPDDAGLNEPAEAPRSPNRKNPANSTFPNRNSALPRLPTEVPDPVIEDSTPTPRQAAPPLTLQPFEDRPATKTNDFSGDGTVGTDSPRGLQQPRLTIEKIAPQQAVLGEPLVYSVIVKNVGGSDARQVVVEDRIPKGTELTGTAPRAEMIDKKLIWRIGTMKPNEEKKISIRVIPRQEGSIGSVARVNFATEVAAEIVVAAPQLSFTANAPRQVRLGETFDMTFLLKNTGSAPASNVSVRDLVPDGLKHEAAADIECPIGKLAPDESREIVLQVTAVKPGKVKNRAILSGDGGIAQELESPIEIIGEQLVLTRSGHNRVFVDRPTVFTNSVKNDGNAEVKQVKVSEIVPAGMEFVEASSGGRFDPVERSIYWTVGPLPPGTQTAVSAKLIAKSPGVQHGKITAAGAAGSAAALKSEVEVVGRPELQIETVGRTGQVAVGDQLTSKIQLTNHGSASAQNVGLSIRLPRELKLVEVRGAKYTIRDNVIAFEPVAAIAPKEAVGLELVMEAVAEADAQMSLEIAADHLSKPARRSETIQIAAEVR